MSNRKKCACCGCLTLTAGSEYEICSICGWEDDPVQNDNPTFEGGANDMSLKQAQKAYKAKKSVH